jgi:hypothetical protein
VLCWVERQCDRTMNGVQCDLSHGCFFEDAGTSKQCGEALE